jgi:hypothetical protein
MCVFNMYLVYNFTVLLIFSELLHYLGEVCLWKKINIFYNTSCEDSHQFDHHILQIVSVMLHISHAGDQIFMYDYH